MSTVPSDIVQSPRRAAPLLVREARSPAEFEAIWAFRYQIYIAEMGKGIACADHSRRWLVDPLDADARQAWVQHHGVILGTMRLHVGNVPDAASRRIDAGRFGPAHRLAMVSKTMVASGERSSHVFAALAQFAYRSVFTGGIEHVVLHCRPSLVPLYERLGFRGYGVEFVDPEVGPQVAMHSETAAAPAILRRGSFAEAA